MADPSVSLGLWEACWRDLVLGIAQGLTEFLPISSTAHLKVVPELLGWVDPGVSVTAAIQLGSIVAVIAYFRRDLAQVLALIPGVSRSGSTLTASLLDGWQRADAARFSFLLGIPAITIAGIVELKDALAATADAGPLPLLVGILAATVVSWLAIDWLLKFLQSHSTWLFVVYRLLFGMGLLAWWSIHGAH